MIQSLLITFANFFLILITCVSLSANTNEYVVIDYRDKSELANQTILDAVQGPNNKMYFLGRNNIVTFDGNEFEVLPQSDVGHSFFYDKLYVDESSHLWFFRDGREIIEFDGNQYNNILLPQKFKVIDAFAVSGKTIVIAADKRVFKYDQGIWLQVLMPGEFQNSAIIDIELQGNRIWIAAENGVLYSKEINTGSFSILTGERVYDLFYDESNSTLYLLMEQLIGKFHNGEFSEFLRSPLLKLRGDELSFINSIGKNELIVGTYLAHLVLNKNDLSLSALNDTYKLSSLNSSKILKDNFNNIWVCSRIGIERVYKTNINTISVKDGLLENNVSSIAQFKNGDLLLGHTKGLTLVKESTGEIRPIRLPNTDEMANIIDLLIDEQQWVWLLIQQIGVGKIDDINQPEKISWFKTDDQLLTMTRLDNGDILVAGRTAFYLLSENKLTKLYGFPPNIAPYFRRVIQTGTTIYGASSQGLIQYDLTSGIISLNEDIQNLYSVEIVNSKLLVGGSEGLFEIDEQNIISRSFGIIFDKSPEVYFIQTSHLDSTLWIGTNEGLFIKNSQRQIQFTKNDGLGDNELNRSAFIIDSVHSKVWVGTIDGLSSFTLDKLHSFNKQPKLFLKSQFMSNSQGDTISLNYNAVSLFPEPKLNFSINVTGIDNGYEKSIITVDKNIVLKNMDAGEYQIELSAFDRFGNKSNTLNLYTKIKNEFWGNELFAVSIFIISGIIVLIVVLQKKSNRNKKKFNNDKSVVITKSYNIRFFGSLTITSPGNQKIETQFSPQIKEIFILLLLYSYNRGKIKGISSEKLSKAIWNESSTQITKNKRNLAIKKLRDLLDQNNLGTTEFINDKWIFRLNKDATFDLEDWNKLRNELRYELPSGTEKIHTFLNIAGRGQFLEDISYEWIEEIKLWYNNETVDILSKILHEEKIDSVIRIKAGKVLNSVDPLNENNMIFLVRFLYKNGEFSSASRFFQQFVNEYEQVFEKKYQFDLNQIISKK